MVTAAASKYCATFCAQVPEDLPFAQGRVDLEDILHMVDQPVHIPEGHLDLQIFDDSDHHFHGKDAVMLFQVGHHVGKELLIDHGRPEGKRGLRINAIPY